MHEGVAVWDRDAVITLNRFAGASTVRRITAIFFATYLPFLMVPGYAIYLFDARGMISMKLIAFTLAIVAGTIARFGVGSPIRATFPRSRPHHVHDINPLIQEESLSLPSGHALFFFAFSTVVIATAPLLGAIYLFLSVIIAIARVAAGVHYPSDTLLGAVLGIAVGIAVNIIM